MSFPLLAIMNNAARNICVQAFVWIYVLNSLGYLFRSGISGSYGNSDFLGNCQLFSEAAAPFYLPTSNV